MSLTAILSLGGMLIDKFVSSPEDKAKAKLEFVKMAQSGELKELEMLVKDRDSARNREIAVGGRMNAFLGGSVVIGFFIVLGFVISGNVPKDVDQMYVGALLGTLGTMTVQVMNYYFGSSVGSKQKTELMNKGL